MLLAAVVTLLVVAAAAAWFVFGRAASPAIVRTANQNVLLITIDTLRADALGSYGGRAATPNLDRLASLGTRFDFAHAHAVVTLPSHASILTGLYPTEHGIHDNAGFRLASKFPTLGAMLRERRMATGAFIGSFALDSRFGLNAGFDAYDERYGKSNIAAGFNMPERRADAVVAAATEWIGRQQQPWFAWVHVFDPHAPYAPPAPFDRQYADSPYAGEVAFTDSALAPLLDAARDASGRPTLVIVTGDHGEGLGDHGELTHGLFAYESTLRIPLIVAQLTRQSAAFAGRVGPASPQTSGLVGRRPRLPCRSPPSPRATWTSCPPSSTLSACRSRRASRDGACCPGAWTTTARVRPTSRRSRPCTTGAGRRSPGCLSIGTSSSTCRCRSCTTCGVDPTEASNLAGREAERQRMLEARLRGFGPATTAARQAEDPAASARLQALGYVTGSAAPKARYTEEDDPKRLVDVDRQLREAVDLYERRQPAAAMDTLRKVIAERPTMEVAYSQLAMIQWETGEPAEAVATLRASIAAGCDSLVVKTRLGTYLAESGQVKEAIPLLQLAAEADAADTDALNALGIALARAGRAAEARAAFERILAAEPGNSMALENLGSIALGEGRMDEARKQYRSGPGGRPGFHAGQQRHGRRGVEGRKPCGCHPALRARRPPGRRELRCALQPGHGTRQRRPDRIGPAVPRAVRPHRSPGVLRPRHPADPGAAAPVEPTAGVTSAPAPAGAASMLRLTRQSVFSRQVCP